MPLTYITELPDTGFARIFDEKNEVSPSKRLPGGDVVVVDPSNGGNDPDWVFVSRKVQASTRGWIPMRFLRKPDPNDDIRFPLIVEPFVRSCGRAELASTSFAGDSAPSILADYLLAWAHIESATEEEDFSNPLPDFENSDAEGPFRLTSEDWKAFQQAADQVGAVISDFERLIPNSQVEGAAYKSQMDAMQFSKLANHGKEPVDGPVIASYLNVLHCHFLGVEAAWYFQKLKNENRGSALVSDALSESVKDTQPDSILKNRERFLKKDDTPVTIDMFFELTSQALADGFKNALVLIREHADFLLPPPLAMEGGAPWMKIAERELKIWQEAELNEETGDGLAKVIDYFKAVDVKTTKNMAWCGAFVGHCLEEVGPKYADTIVKDGAKAISWLFWGNMNMRQYDLRDIPLGAVVVTMPMSKGTSGHVGFATGKVSGTDKIVVLGGNQDDSVTLKHIHKNRIRQIRWHTSLLNSFESNIGSETDPKLGPLLGLIASRESNGNYNAYYSKANNQSDPELTAMTIQEVRTWQDTFVANGSASSAVGKYQIIRSTMDEIIDRLNLNSGDAFDESMQDRMAIGLLNKRKLGDFLSDAISVTQFGNNLAMEWASLPVLSPIENSKGRIVARGQSYYAGDGLNRAHVAPEQVEAILKHLKGVA